MIDNALKQDLARILAGRNVVKAVLFGSFARGTQSRHSDIDLMLIQKTDRRFLDRYNELYPEIMRLFRGRGVDLLIYTPEEIAAISHRKFIQTILQKGVTIYEQGTTTS